MTNDTDTVDGSDIIEVLSTLSHHKRINLLRSLTKYAFVGTQFAFL